MRLPKVIALLLSLRVLSSPGAAKLYFREEAKTNLFKHKYFWPLFARLSYKHVLKGCVRR